MNTPNLYCLKRRNTGTNSLEVHILNGADNFQTFPLHTGTPTSTADAANFRSKDHAKYLPKNHAE